MPPSTKKPRHNGPWSPLYGQAWDHAKTHAAVSHLVSIDRKVPRECATAVILGWLVRLNIWCLANNEDGVVGGLPDVRIALIAWPEAVEARSNTVKLGAEIRDVLRVAGFLEGSGSAERIHEFRWHHRGILRERDRKRGGRDSDFSADDSAEHSADDSADTPADSGSGRVGAGRGGTERGGAGPAASPPQPSPSAPPEPDSVASLSRDLATAADEEPGVAEKVIRELLAVGTPVNYIRARIASIERPIGGWAWKRSVVDAWREASPSKATSTSRPDFGPKAPVRDVEAQARRVRERVASEALDVEFKASGYTSRQAWQADRATGEVRTGEAAASRRFAIGRGAHDASDEVRSASCGPERRAPQTARRPLAPAHETPT